MTSSAVGRRPGGGLILLDKSAWVRADPNDIERHGEPCLCAITRLEILYSTSSPADYAAQQAALALFRDLRIDAQTITTAESAQRELATRSQHRVSLPDLILGACAQQHGAGILHVDRDFDVLTTVFGFRSLRVPG
jgi:predicted nucleic acid-binding protein